MSLHKDNLLLQKVNDEVLDESSDGESDIFDSDSDYAISGNEDSTGMQNIQVMFFDIYFLSRTNTTNFSCYYHY